MKRQHLDNINTGEHFDNLYSGRRREEMLPYAPLKLLLPLIVTGGNVLDVGCGWGQYYNILAANGSFYTGIDFAEASIREARQNYPHGEFHCSDFSQALPFRNDYFSCVVCFETLEHMADPQRLISEICRVLKPGGTALLSTPYTDGIITPEHLWEFEENDWRSMLTDLSYHAQFRFSNETDKWEHFFVVARK